MENLKESKFIYKKTDLAKKNTSNDKIITKKNITGFRGRHNLSQY